MTTNPAFNNFSASNEQSLLESLIVESIKVYGQDMIYLPRHNDNYDPLYETSDLVTFSDHYTVEMYIKSVDGFSGDGNFMSQFGLEIRDQIVFTVAKRSFDQAVGTPAHLVRPREGDLIYFPLNNKCFEIKFADNKPTFYQLGALQTYNLTCELYEYSTERFETGIAEIDKIYQRRSLDVSDLTANGVITANTTTNADDRFELQNLFDDSKQIKKEDDFIDFSRVNPFSEKI